MSYELLHTYEKEILCQKVKEDLKKEKRMRFYRNKYNYYHKLSKSLGLVGLVSFMLSFVFALCWAGAVEQQSYNSPLWWVVGAVISILGMIFSFCFCVLSIKSDDKREYYYSLYKEMGEI